MAIHTFSTKELTEQEVQKLKKHCKKKYKNFSAMVCVAITKLNKELEDESSKQ